MLEIHGRGLPDLENWVCEEIELELAEMVVILVVIAMRAADLNLQVVMEAMIGLWVMVMRWTGADLEEGGDGTTVEWMKLR